MRQKAVQAQHIGSDQRLSQTSPRHKCTMAVAAAADKQAVLFTMLQQALRAFFRMVGVVALKAVEFFRPQDVEHALQAWPMKAAGGHARTALRRRQRELM